MFAVIVGLSGAVIFGGADFLGGIAARRISALRVTALGAASGFLVLLVLLPVFGGEWSSSAVLLGAISGLTGAAAVSLLYACLAIGPMSILSPLTAVVSAIVPLTVELIRGSVLEPIGYLALALALVAVVLVGFVPDPRAVRPSLRALAMAAAAGALIGVFLIVIDLTPDDSGLVPLVVNRATNATVMFLVIGAIALFARRSSTAVNAAALGWRAGLLVGLAAGMVDATANALLLFGLRIGDLSIMSVLTAMYPAGTIICAAVILKERIAPTQVIGLVLAITAAAMLALA